MGSVEAGAIAPKEIEMKRESFQIISMMPAVGWRAAVCSFISGKPKVQDLLVAGLAVVRYAGCASDVIEPILRYEDVEITLPETAMRAELRYHLHDEITVAAPNEVIDCDYLISTTRFHLEMDLRRYKRFEKDNGFAEYEDRKYREDFAHTQCDTVEEWARLQRYGIEARLTEPAAAVRVGEDATPAQIMQAWKEKQLREGKNPNEEFERQFGSAAVNKAATAVGIGQ